MVYFNDNDKSDENAFIESLKNQDLASIINCINNGFDVNYIDEIALRYAINVDNLDLLKCLVNLGASIEKYNTRFLSDSIVENNVPFIEYLLENGNIIDITIINIAIEKENMYVIEYLETNNEYINQMFCTAVKYGNMNLMIRFLNLGADIHYNDESALQNSVKSGHIEIVSYLVNNGALINARKSNALIKSAEYGNFNITKYLIESGANILNCWFELLCYAIQYSNSEILPFILSYEIKISEEDLESILEKIIEYEDLKFIDLLADYNIHFDNDKAFLFSVLYDNFTCVEYFINLGADIHVQEDKALCECIEGGFIEIFNYLIQLGASIDGEKEINFVESDDLDIFKYIVEYRNLDINDEHLWKTVVHNGGENIINYLINEGVDYRMDNDYALHYFLKIRYSHHIKLLLKYYDDNTLDELLQNSEIQSLVYKFTTYYNNERLINAMKNNGSDIPITITIVAGKLNPMESYLSMTKFRLCYPSN